MGSDAIGQAFYQMGTFGKAFHNHVQNLGVTPVAVGVPYVSNSQGLRAAWMEMYIALAVGSAAGVVWNFDTPPGQGAEDLGAILPQQTLCWYPVSPNANTLYVASYVANSTRLQVNWYMRGPKD